MPALTSEVPPPHPRVPRLSWNSFGRLGRLGGRLWWPANAQLAGVASGTKAGTRPKQDLPLRPHGYENSKHESRIEVFRRPPNSVQSSALPSVRIICADVFKAQCHRRTVTTQSYKLSHFANAKNGTEKKGILLRNL